MLNRDKTYALLRKRLKEGWRYQDIVDQGSFSMSWLTKFGAGISTNPRARTVLELHDVLRNLGR